MAQFHIVSFLMTLRSITPVDSLAIWQHDTLQLVSNEDSRSRDRLENHEENAAIPGPYMVKPGSEVHLSEKLEEKVLNIATVIQSITNADLGDEVLASVGHSAQEDYEKAKSVRSKILTKQKLILEEVVEVVSMLTKTQTAESAVKNEALLTSTDIAELMGGFRSEEWGSNYTFKLDTYQGDILQDSGKANPWPLGHVKYCFAKDVSERVKHVFRMATKRYMQAMPCLNFEEIGWKAGTSYSARQFQNCADGPSLFVTSNTNYGCFSHRGMLKVSSLTQSQPLNLHDPGCTFVGTVMHELGHALGLGHTKPTNETRVHHHMTKKGSDSSFAFDAADSFVDANASLSIMHYDAHAFARGSDPTLSGPGRDIFGQRVGLGLYDVVSLSHLYRQTSADCVRSGLAGYGTVDDYEIQCWQGSKCPGFVASTEPNMTDGQGDEDEEDLFSSIKGIVR